MLQWFKDLCAMVKWFQVEKGFLYMPKRLAIFRWTEDSNTWEALVVDQLDMIVKLPKVVARTHPEKTPPESPMLQRFVLDFSYENVGVYAPTNRPYRPEDTIR